MNRELEKIVAADKQRLVDIGAWRGRKLSGAADTGK